MPAHHDVRSEDVHVRRLRGNLAAAADRGPQDFAELLLTPGVGARTVKALAMVAEVVHGTPCRFDDPARFSLAHGGKDRHPYPVPLKVYDETIRVLKSAVQQAKLGREEELGALKRLDDQSRVLERIAGGPTRCGSDRAGARALASLRRAQRVRCRAAARKAREVSLGRYAAADTEASASVIAFSASATARSRIASRPASS